MRGELLGRAVTHGEITLSARFVLETRDGICTMDCVPIQAECALGALPEGRFRATLGELMLDFVVPAEPGALCTP